MSPPVKQRIPANPANAYRFIPGSGTDFSYGDEPKIASALSQLAQKIHQNIYGISGHRTPAHSVAVGGFANDPHTRGQAADIGVGSSLRASAGQLSSAELASVGLYRPFYPADPDEINHVQLLAGGATASGTGSTDAVSGGGVGGAVSGAGGLIGNVATSTVGAVADAAGGAADVVTGGFDAAKAFADFVSDPARAVLTIALVIGGAAAVLVGVSRATGVRAPIPKAIP
ncbi:MAG: hypothetical protein QOI11_1832 [Candidatus Eremiobacteraeota bacterium]|jgi:hypothetical protein|nr:hypothetical protein [Candidatus Eremiobacteraeota bacterium]